MNPIELARIEVSAFRTPVEMPIRVSFGTFQDRPLVLVRVADVDGAEGWGEVWSNWPPVGAEHRARLAEAIGARLLQRRFTNPEEAWRALTSELEIMVLQTGEVGPIAQAIAGIDIALWDLVARREGLPLYRCLGSAPVESVPVYATSINPDQPERFAAACYESGHRAFKLKVGFDHERDLANLSAMRKVLGPDAGIMADANQAFTLESAIAFCRAAAELKLQWLEEPLRVDAPAESWRRLAGVSPIPLAGGENFADQQFDEAIAGDILQVVQPDVTKWGGISRNAHIGRAAVNAGKRYCPHFFNGGIGLLASLHLLAFAGGEGLLEFDCYPNPGRELIVGSLLPVQAGRVPVPTGPGLGATPDLAALDRYRTWPPRG
jgi:D-galactarolactone cycloisomerase